MALSDTQSLHTQAIHRRKPDSGAAARSNCPPSSIADASSDGYGSQMGTRSTRILHETGRRPASRGLLPLRAARSVCKTRPRPPQERLSGAGAARTTQSPSSRSPDLRWTSTQVSDIRSPGVGGDRSPRGFQPQTLRGAILTLLRRDFALRYSYL